jgi:hypothetical protein
MSRMLLTISAILLTGCAQTDTDAKTLLETLEFEASEYGHIKATGDINVGTVPFFSTKIHIDYEKSKDAPSE